MKKSSLIFLMCLFSVLNSYCFSTFEEDSLKTNYLQECFSKSREGDDTTFYRKLFFNAYPNTFSEFRSIYFTGQLKSVSMDHLRLFSEVSEKEIDVYIYLSKLLDLCKEGKWDVDAVFLLQRTLRYKMKEYPKESFLILDTFSDKELDDLFYFYFDSVHPEIKTIPSEFAEYEASFSRIFEVMKISLNKVLDKAKRSH